jgi:hypothetical protein
MLVAGISAPYDKEFSAYEARQGSAWRPAPKHSAYCESLERQPILQGTPDDSSSFVIRNRGVNTGVLGRPATRRHRILLVTCAPNPTRTHFPVNYATGKASSRPGPLESYRWRGYERNAVEC